MIPKHLLDHIAEQSNNMKWRMDDPRVEILAKALQKAKYLLAMGAMHNAEAVGVLDAALKEAGMEG